MRSVVVVMTPRTDGVRRGDVAMVVIVVVVEQPRGMMIRTVLFVAQKRRREQAGHAAL